VHRRHSAKVALVATALTMVLYVLAVTVVDVLVTGRLSSHVETTLAQRLSVAQRSTLEVPGAVRLPDADTDHDVPTFLWRVDGAGRARALSLGAPALPLRPWPGQGTTSFSVSGTPFEFRSVPSGAGWLVAGQSTADIARVRSDLLLSEVLVGALLAVLAYLGALAIGLRASAPLEDVRRRQSEFTADASHELRTPLSVIEAEVDLALSKERDAPYYETTLGRVRHESHRLRRIVDDLLWLARADGAANKPAEGTVDVAEGARAAADRFAVVAGAREVALETRVVGEREAMVAGSPEWLDRLLGVLLDNACRFAGPQGRVEVVVTTTSTKVSLAVDDSGPGVPVEERPRIFDRFHRVADDSPGTGLGLAIADAVVRATEGEWAIADSPLGGARLQVTWRRAARPAPREVPGPPTGGTGERQDERPAGVAR
jgi:signal transduction histidine kinase